MSPAEESASTRLITTEVADLPAGLVHEIIRQARKLGMQDYALAYVLFSAGLSVSEIASLQRSHHIYAPQGHFLQITIPGCIRQIPVNQWILGKRYGSYTNNPLIKWLKSRKDNQSAMFVNAAGQPISDEEILEHWQKWTQGLLTPQGQPPTITQAKDTWCVEMLMRGISLENLSIITSSDRTQLQHYARRAREKAALEQAMRLDQK